MNPYELKLQITEPQEEILQTSLKSLASSIGVAPRFVEIG